MGKWLFPLSLIAAAIFIFAAAKRTPKPPEPVIAAAYPKTLLARDPIARNLREIDRHARRLRAVPIPAPPPALSQNVATAGDGFASRRAVFETLLLKSYDDDLRAALDESRSRFDMLTESNYNSMIADLEDFSKTLRDMPPDEDLAGKKFELFNLRLKLDSLTKDKATIPALKPDELENRKNDLEKNISESETARTGAIATSQQQAADDLLAGFRAEMGTQDKKLREEMESRMTKSRADAEFIMRRFDGKLAESKEQLSKRRKQTIGDAALIRADAVQAMSAPGAAETLKKYESVFREIMRRKARAAAVDQQLDIVLDTPVYRSPNVRDITGSLSEN